MKPFWKDVLAGLVMGLAVPGILLNFAVAMLNREKTEAAPVPETAAGTTEASETAPERVSMSMRLRREDGTVEEMDMDTYLVGVVLAEMPAYFETEALKAQAVVARTYTQKAYVTGGKHADGSVCTKSTCCQAYTTEADYLARGGSRENVDKVRDAVLATSGYVLTYGGTLIEATYFSCSGGSTEDAAAVWGTDFPYLRAVDSPGEEEAAHYTDTETFTAAEFQKALGVTLSGSPSGWLGAVTYTAGGGVDTMVIGGTEYSGTRLRSLLGLRSTAFTMTASGDAITVTTRGYGHRVGMSQYGADAMAVTGSSYVEILEHYYQGAVLEKWDAEK